MCACVCQSTLTLTASLARCYRSSPPPSRFDGGPGVTLTKCQTNLVPDLPDTRFPLATPTSVISAGKHCHELSVAKTPGFEPASQMANGTLTVVNTWSACLLYHNNLVLQCVNTVIATAEAQPYIYLVNGCPTDCEVDMTSFPLWYLMEIWIG